MDQVLNMAEPQMPNNHINNLWYFYGSQPHLANAAKELRKETEKFRHFPVTSKVDKPIPGAENITLEPYQSSMCIR